MIIRMRLRAGAAIPGRLSTHPLCPRSPGTGPSEQSTTQQQRRTRLPPSAPTTKSPAQDGISIESHPRSSTEPNFVTTVSPQHAWEAQYTEQGQGLGHTLHLHGGKFGGVLNGVDYDLWNPEIDPFIPARYGSEWIDGKYVNKQALRERFLLAHGFKPVVASIGRLDRQKGVDLIRHALFYALAEGAQFVLLGSGPDPAIGAEFWASQARAQRQSGLPSGAHVQRRAGAFDLRGRRLVGDAEHVRAVRADAADRAQVRDGADRARRSAGWSIPCLTATTRTAGSATATSFTTQTTRRWNRPCSARSACGTPILRSSASCSCTGCGLITHGRDRPRIT